MSATLELESTLTDRYQTTVPDAVRKSLKLGKRDKIHYAIQPDGSVLLTRAAPKEEDPALASFLQFLARDMEAHPQHLAAVDRNWLAHAQALVGDVAVDLDAPLLPEQE